MGRLKMHVSVSRLRPMMVTKVQGFCGTQRAVGVTKQVSYRMGTNEEKGGLLDDARPGFGRICQCLETGTQVV